MKTSFYFVMWIAIYPLLALIPNPGIQDYSFMVALVVVFVVSMAINKLMFRIIFYENVSRGTEIMEDIYNGNVAHFRKRIDRDTAIETLSAIYFITTTALLLYMLISSGLNNNIVALVVFAFLSIGAYTRAGKLIKASIALRKDPSAEECMSVAYSIFNLNYENYYVQRIDRQLSDLLPERPKGYTLFIVISIIFAIISMVLGLLFISLGTLGLIRTGMSTAGWFFLQILYGTLAIYFGFRDCVDSIQSFKRSKTLKT